MGLAARLDAAGTPAAVLATRSRFERFVASVRSVAVENL
jgi:hypothetical protein